jgi:hypothetical protein
VQCCSALTPLGHSECWTDPVRAEATWIGVRMLRRLVLAARVVALPRAYPQTFVMLSSLKPLFFNLGIPHSLLRGYRMSPVSQPESIVTLRILSMVADKETEGIVLLLYRHNRFPVFKRTHYLFR